MDERAGLAWLGRKVGWGLASGQLDEWTSLGAPVVIDRLVDPEQSGIETRPDPFAHIDLADEISQRIVANSVHGWIDSAITSPRPLETFMEFFWSDYFAVSARVVRPQSLLLGHMDLLAKHCLGNFAEMLRDVSIDPAMLEFLDGALSTKDNPNENYGRELLELYSVGVGNFTEDDVKAAARALTGWTLQPRRGIVRFAPGLHDDSAQTLLGVQNVSDLDTAIEAVLAHPATAIRVVDKLATAILGTGYDPALVVEVAAAFARDWELRPVIRLLLELGVAGHAVPTVLDPLAWYVTVRRLPTPTARRGQFRDYFTLSGQVLMHPPNVGGFPPPDAYLSTSATIARFNLASHLAGLAAEDRPTGIITMTNDLDVLAERLGLVNGFLPATANALLTLEAGGDRLAAALASPDMAVV